MFKAVLLAQFFAILPITALCVEDIKELLCTQEYSASMRTHSMFQKIDLNGDGKITHDEIVTYFGTIFDALDIDRNGVLDDKEWFGARTSVPVINYSSGGYAKQLATDRMMRIMDRKNHKVVTKDDFISQHEKIYEAMTNSHSEPLDSEHWLASHFPK
jgi:Ca2+-binding EF-hand superfamily protein